MDSMSTVLWRALLLAWVEELATWRTTNLTCRLSIIAGALVIDEPPQQWEHALAVGERRQFTGELIKLRAVHAQEAVRVVQRLHRNLGHPTTEQLLLILESRGASHQVIQAARDFKCVACQRYRKPKLLRRSLLRRTSTSRCKLTSYGSRTRR